ncbi:MAG: BspA family leucine-rich repeat surface protein [Bradymonadales bacterium]|nr:BspA family leucine-rich repeat surface protein [Bradymonadales bacterium]
MKKRSFALLISAFMVSACMESASDDFDSAQCSDGIRKCNDNVLSKCIAGKWHKIKTCDDTTQCNNQTGECDPIGSICIDGTWKCNDNVLSKCESGDWILKQTCDKNTLCNVDIGECTPVVLPEIKCQSNEHIFANRCEPDDENHCGTHTNDCTKLSGWKSGSCIDKQCYAYKCATGYHLASIINANGNEKTICEQDTHDACGSINTQCGADEICAQGVCTDKCQPGEVICNGSCINPKTNTQYCGADPSCRGFATCSGTEKCVDGSCLLSSCAHNETLCTKNGQKICVDVNGNNPYHCGACGSTCVDTEIAKATGCNQGKCTYICYDNNINCGSNTEPLCMPRERLKRDPLNCGKCNKACEANELCQDGQCLVNSCIGNACHYNNACVNLNDHCGTQCLNCSVANNASAGYCQNGTCVITACANGYHLSTDGTCEIDSATACPNGQASATVNCNAIEYTQRGICEDKICKAKSCKANAHVEGNICVPDTVGACGPSKTNCRQIPGWKAGECKNGVCVATACRLGFCLNTLHGKCTSAQNNSTCGVDGGACQSCTIKHVCSAGACVDKKCVGNVCQQKTEAGQEDICQNDNTHCGSSCQDCTLNATASTCNDEGYCQITACEKGYHEYNNTCEADSIEHCGAHGNACSVENGISFCNEGKCDFDCHEGYKKVNNSCEMRPKFILVWKRRLEPQGKYTDNVCIPIGKRSSSIKICWGTSTSPGKEPCTTIESKNAAEYYCHHYDDGSDESTITITGEIEDWSCSAGSLSYCNGYLSDAHKFNGYLKKIESYGEVKFGNYAFQGTRLEGLPPDESPKFSNNSMKGAFANSNFNQDISHWDTSYITDMSSMFSGATNFNRPLDKWNTTNVKVMSGMFYGATNFNRPLNNWNTTNVTSMSKMFEGAQRFNQPLDKWNTSNVKDMSYMFASTERFNQPLDKWNTSNVKVMSSMFSDATNFNHPLDKWDTSNVTNMSEMFNNAVSFNRPLNTWNTANVTSIDKMFNNAASFDQPLDKWNVSKISSMNMLFYESGMTRDNYCKLFEGAYKSRWEKFKKVLGKYFNCD